MLSKVDKQYTKNARPAEPDGHLRLSNNLF